jgi:hypothetical protein
MHRLFGAIFLTLLLFVAMGAALAFPAYEVAEAASTSLIPLSGPLDSSLCLPLPAPTGNVITVSNVSQLQSAVNSAISGTTILVTDGTYNLNGVYLQFATPNVTLRSASGNREAVILNGNYITTEIIQIIVSNVTIADLTLREAQHHPIHVATTASSTEDVDNTLIYNVHIIDPGQQAIKINPWKDAGGTSYYYPDYGEIACSHIELTDTGRPQVWAINGSCYTGGVDAHQARDWVIRDNRIEGFWCPTGLSEHGIHFWVTCRDPVVERNVLRNNARGIGFGLQESGSGRTYSDDPCPGAGGYVDHYGGVIRNNFVFANRTELFSSEYGFDTGIALWQACGSRVLHNTVASTQAPFSSIEWRFSRTDVDIINNLVTHNLMDRGGTVNLLGNLQSQPLSLFITATNAIDQVAAPADVSDDIDGDTRPIGSASDIGADEYGISPPAAVTDLRVSQAVTTTGMLTATLRWTAPTGALTTTLRYSNALITAGNWNSAILLTDTLTGAAEIYTATIPYSGGTAYFALKTQGVGGESNLSNNASWPHVDVYLPLILRN